MRQHEITTGIEQMFEGVTVPTVDLQKQEPTKHTAGMHLEREQRHLRRVQLYRDAHGRRLLMDGGFTRLYPQFWNRTAGTARYVVNVWREPGRRGAGDGERLQSAAVSLSLGLAYIFGTVIKRADASARPGGSPRLSRAALGLARLGVGRARAF